MRHFDTGLRLKSIYHLLLVTLLTWFGGLFPLSAKSQAEQSTIYLPMITAVDLVYTPNEEEQRIAELMKTAPGQQRSELHYNEILSKVARQRAQDMAQRCYVAHVNPDGVGPNFLVSQAGYLLPSFYPQVNNANNIESIGAGQTTPEQAWEAWLNSPHHRTHVLGTDPFFAAQTDYGIGYAYKADSPYIYYWVIMTAQPGP
ncbi:MAG: CAP domain-containing protein [Caldilineaceae bacterium]